MVKDTKKAADLLIGIAVVIVSIIFFVAAWGMPDQARGIGPGDYPMFVSALLFILGMTQVIKTLLISGIALIDFRNMNKRYICRALIMAGATLLYYLLLDIIGFPIITPIYLFLSMMFFGYKNKVKAAVISIVFSTLVYLLFVKVFMVLLPDGIFF